MANKGKNHTSDDREGGVNITGGGKVTVLGDMVGRDKVVSRPQGIGREVPLKDLIADFGKKLDGGLVKKIVRVYSETSIFEFAIEDEADIARTAAISVDEANKATSAAFDLMAGK